MKRRVLLGFIVAVVLLAVLIRTVGSEDILSELTTVDRRFLAFAIGSGLLALTFRGLVWDRFLGLIDQTMSRPQIGTIFLTAMFVKYVTPYGQVATEPFVAYLLSRDGEMAFEDGLAGIVSADFLNYVPYYTFGFAALALLLTDRPLGADMRARAGWLVLLFLALLVAVYVVLGQQQLVSRVVVWTTSLLRRPLGRFSDRFDTLLAPDRIRARLEGFYSTIDLISADRRSLLLAVLFAHLGMLFLMLPVYFGARSLGHELAIPIVALVVALGKLGSLVPAPGGTGGVETIVAASLATLGGLEWAVAVSIALIYRACTYWLTIVLGGCAATAFVITRD